MLSISPNSPKIWWKVTNSPYRIGENPEVYTEEQKKKIKLLKHIAKRNKEIFSITSSKVSYYLAEKEVIDNLK